MTDGQRTEHPAGLRERKKQRTRDALVHAALVLFTTQGYDRTTVDEIVDAVEVSQRTFFRYFASKEEVAFAAQEMVESHFLSELRQRPADEAPFEAMRRAVLCAWNSIGETIEELVTVDLHMRTYQLIESHPTLLAAHLRRCIDLEDRIARLIAEREGLDVTSDPRPRVAVAAFSGVMRVAGQLWGRGHDPSVESLRDLTECYLDQLAPALAGDWRQDAPAHGPYCAVPLAPGHDGPHTHASAAARTGRLKRRPGS
ncbi:TetR family transcriptional regulator [Streptomyces sp. NBC_00654]|uniref:TetR family transcriptional regulator n=1 Tax=Streptomyces sp. NBC_00654 TaxID=2975799 RepID=UPI00224E5368|nr:TetR family transcriptional regulator [Streptomyces sp. NBC_00654]MCX4969097.1 TetR family transcriptional regulator [Streptomyces sp. NBC_00654]